MSWPIASEGFWGGVGFRAASGGAASGCVRMVAHEPSVVHSGQVPCRPLRTIRGSIRSASPQVTMTRDVMTRFARGAIFMRCLQRDLRGREGAGGADGTLSWQLRADWGYNIRKHQ